MRTNDFTLALLYFRNYFGLWVAIFKFNYSQLNNYLQQSWLTVLINRCSELRSSLRETVQCCARRGWAEQIHRELSTRSYSLYIIMLSKMLTRHLFHWSNDNRIFIFNKSMTGEARDIKHNEKMRSHWSHLWLTWGHHDLHYQIGI